MERWLAGAAGVVLAGIALWWVQQVAQRGVRWRALTLAGHELDVAAKLEHDDPHAVELRRRAGARLDRYLTETNIDLGDERRQHGWFLGAGVVSAVMLFTTLAPGDTGLPGFFVGLCWVAFGMSVLIALTEAWLLMRLPHRRAAPPPA